MSTPIDHAANWPEHIVAEADCYFHDVLTPRKKMHVETHCQTCEMCRTALEEARKRFEAAKNVTSSEASESLIQGALKKIDDHEAARRRRFRLLKRSALGGVLGALLLFVAGRWYYSSLGPSPFDLRMLAPAQLAADSEASLRVWVMHHDKGTGIAHVPVSIDLGDKEGNTFIHLAQFETDAHGTGAPTFRLPKWFDADCQLRVTAEPGGAPQVLTQPVRLKRHFKLMLTSDRPVYQPGQTIHVRSLALSALDLKPALGQKAVFTVTDPKGNVIFKEREVASKFGIASANCVLADEILEGVYTVNCELGDGGGEGELAALKVQVQKYVLPKFKIAVNFDKPYFQPGERIAGKIKAEYFFGKAISEGDGSIDLELTNALAKPGVVEQTLKPGPKGETAFSFPPAANSQIPADDNQLTLDLSVRVSDSAGQVQTRKAPIIITAQPLRIDVVPEAGSLVWGLANKVYVLVTGVDGKPAANARVVISGISSELQTNDLGLAQFEFTPREEKVEWTVRAENADGDKGRRQLKLECEKKADDFLFRTDKAVCDPGDTLRIEIVGPRKGQFFVDLVKDGQTRWTQTIFGSTPTDLHLPPDLVGSFQLFAYRIEENGLSRPKVRVIYVQPASAVRIESKMDRPEYTPGARARLQFLLTDHEGAPLPGALSLAGVDEAVFSVLEQSRGSESTFFTWNPALLKASGGGSWSPNVATPGTAEESRLFQQAVFSNSVQPRITREELINKLLPYVENSRRVFEVLDRPDWENLAERVGAGWMPEQLIAALRDNSGLTGSRYQATFDDNFRQAEARQNSFLRILIIAVSAIILLLLGSAAVCGIGPSLMRILDRRTSFGPPVGAVIGAFVISSLGLFVILVYFGPRPRIREAAGRTQVVNDMKQIGLAFEAAKEVMPAPQFNNTGVDGFNGAFFKQRSPSIHLLPFIEKTQLYARWDNKSAPVFADPPRIRDWFPETLLWRPELITDDQGRAELPLDLADSITTWRLSASAVTADGRLGASTEKIKVFQPFFVDVQLPVALTRGDEVAVPVVVYSYVDQAQEVLVKLTEADWFERLDQEEKVLTLKAHEVKATSFRLRARKVGRHQFEVAARSSGRAAKNGTRSVPTTVADAIRRKIEVVPDGRAVEKAFNGVLAAPAEIAFDVPENATPDSARLLLKIYPTPFSQAIEGLESIFRMPSGCFEQTSSTTYPNVLALDYLKRTKKNLPQVEETARKYIHLGYQRLLGFEVQGGGFDWFGRAPANRTLTAYGLMEFEDMARVHDVDPKLIERTRKWLLEKRLADGSWDPEGHVPANLPSGHLGGEKLARLSTTAYIAWAVFGNGQAKDHAEPTRRFLLNHPAAQIDDPHVLALMSNALLAMDSTGWDAARYLDRLDELKKTSADRTQVFWQQQAGGRTTFYGAGQSGNVETTALATLALMQAQRSPASISGALAWLSSQRDPHGTWHSTQATVLALKTLLAGSDVSAPARQVERRIQVTFADGQTKSIVIPADQAEVMKQLNLTEHLGKGANRLTLADQSQSRPGYQVVLRYHEPEPRRQDGEPFTILLHHEKDKVKVGELLAVKASIRNEQPVQAPMVMVELPIPAGFSVVMDDWTKLAEKGKIAKFQVQPGRVLVYLRDLEPGQTLELPYALRALMPARVQVPAARVYEYYNPARSAMSRVALLNVVEP